MIETDIVKPMRVLCLEEAARLTTGKREEDYGDPATGMERAAQIYTAWTGTGLQGSDIAKVLIAVKLSRLAHSPLHRDSWVDAMAYLGICYECEADEKDAL